MKQVLQDFKTGELGVYDVPPPSLISGGVLVSNRYSLISAGTERGTVAMAQSSLVGKARRRPDLVRQVIDSVRKEGLASTLTKVRSRLETLKPLGYSCCGRILEVGPEAGDLRAGQWVACGGGGYAVHAEVVTVPKNLVVPLPEGVSPETGAFATLGAVALQGVRQADLRLGETALVIGLGLLGQLTVRLLRAAGVTAYGLDINSLAVNRALESGAAGAYDVRTEGVEDILREATGRMGFDGVLITAAGSDPDPIQLAGRLARERAKVVIVGAVRADIPRSPYYEKELEVRFSRSYGPGRYDASYEEGGHDYPVGYVRWTENRNMQAFLQMVASGAMEIESLVSHRFAVEQAPAAYDLILGKTGEPFLGVLLGYEGIERIESSKIQVTSESATPVSGDVGVGFIGAGNFARAYLLPHIQKESGVRMAGVATATGSSGKVVADRFGFDYCTTDAKEILADDGVHAVFIATRHGGHAQEVASALRAGKHVFVEKPLALNDEQLAEVEKAYAETRALENPPLLQVGFNRRFAPVAALGREALSSAVGPTFVTYRVSPGIIPPSHWVHDPKAGGGRVLGEVCHFVDLAGYLIGERPVQVRAWALESDSEGFFGADHSLVTLVYPGGSLASIAYMANAPRRLPKERVEAFRGGVGLVIDDYRGGRLLRGDDAKEIKKSGKGHREEIIAFFDAIRTGRPAPIAFDDLRATTRATFAILESIRSGEDVLVDGAGN